MTSRSAKSVIANVTLPDLSTHRRRTGSKADWPACAACSRFTLRPVDMYSVRVVDTGDRHVTILGVCKVHGEQALRIDFQRRYTEGEMSTAWRQLVFHEGEVTR